MKVIYRAVSDPFMSNAKWVRGTCGDLRFEAKIYPVGSKYGLKKGPVSKLWIVKEHPEGGNKVVYSYDRGIGIRSNDPKVQALKNYILAHAKAMYGRRK